jgi:predicted RecA/RadA family phage recombinase
MIMAVAQYVGKGERIEYTANDVDIPAGALVGLEDFYCVATSPIPAYATGTVVTGGLFLLPKPNSGPSSSFPIGQQLYWDEATQKVSTSDTNTYLGRAAKSADLADTHALVLLNV